jgi:hypothetical protein
MDGFVRAAPILVVMFVGALAAGGADAAEEDGAQLAALARTVEADPSEKARIAAVVALGRLGHGQALGTLLRALARDASPIVRGLAASALGHGGDSRAVTALEKALADPDAGVRTRVREALQALRRAPSSHPAAAPQAVPTRVRIAPREPPRRQAVHVKVNPMAVRAPAGRDLGHRMRDLVVRQLAGEPGLLVGPGELGDDGSGGGELVVDGTITRLSHEARGPWIETTCEIKLTVSNGSGSLLSIVSGGATVQTARGAWSKRLEPTLRAEALDNAVLGLQANLVTLLARHAGR